MAYKGSMTLDDAYQELNLAPPLEWEMSRSATLPIGWDQDPLRGSGTTTQTLVEMYLDLQLANRVAGTRQRNKVKFLCVTEDKDAAKELRRQFSSIHAQLAGDLTLSQVRFMPRAKLQRQLSGERYYSWAVFCDHHVKEADGHRRSDGPFRFARRLEAQEDGNVLVKDRDNEIIGLTDHKTAQQIMDAKTTPMSYQVSPKVKPATYPAMKLQSAVLILNRQFVL